MASEAFCVCGVTEGACWNQCVGAYFSLTSCLSGWLVCHLAVVHTYRGNEEYRSSREAEREVL